MDNTMKKRWISLYVENQVGVLSKISGLFSGKSYNLESLTVGRTEDPTISRMTIETNSDEETYEQIKKQLNRMVEVIKVIDFTEVSVVMQELMFIKVKNCTPEDKTELFQIAQTYQPVDTPTPTPSLLKKGSSGDEVRAMQQRHFGDCCGFGLSGRDHAVAERTHAASELLGQ